MNKEEGEEYNKLFTQQFHTERTITQMGKSTTIYSEEIAME
jgi:hypothetical protein